MISLLARRRAPLAARSMMVTIGAALASLSLAAGATAQPCPTVFDFTGDGVGSDADLGVAGFGHDQLLTGFRLRFAMGSCAGSAQPSCGECDLTGLVSTPGRSNRRCVGDTSIPCTSDGACGADAPCRFFASPPLPVAIGGVGVCLVNQVTGSATGTLDVEAGSLAADVPLRTDAFVGPSPDRPCPTCEAGVCSGGARNGLACQVDSSSPYFGDTSFDCPIDPVLSLGPVIDGAVPFSTGTQTSTLSAASPACTSFGYGALKCQCDVCTGGGGEPCATAADCPPAQQCGGTRCLGGGNEGQACTAPSQCLSGVCGNVGYPTTHNACVDFNCTPTGGGEGSCLAGPFTGHCLPSQPYRECLAVTDCPSPGDTCAFSGRECYLDNGLIGGSTSVTGVADPNEPTLGALTCSSVAGSPAVNSAFGLPGLVRLRLPGETTLVASTGNPCPSALQVDVDPLTAAADLGWTGILHDNPLVGWTLRMSVDACTGSTQPSCGECAIAGLIPTAGAGNQRCVGDTSIVCQADSDCGAEAPCRFHASPPLGFGGGGVTACMTNEVAGAVVGTVDVEGGGLEAVLPLEERLFLTGTLARPCPTCESGTCNGGPRNGMPCEVHGSSPLFGDTSLDCPPGDPVLDSFGSLSLSAAPMTLSTGTQGVVLAAASPDCRQSGFTTFECLCDTCQTAAAEPCTSNADCPVGRTCGGRRCLPGSGVLTGNPCTTNPDCSPGICGVPGQSTAPNSCSDATCTPTGGGEGACFAGPFDLHCSTDTYRGCFVDGDCRPFGEGGSCFDCTPGFQTCDVAVRECYTDNGLAGAGVGASGQVDPPSGNTASPVLASVFCIPPTAAPAANSVGGFPGLGRYRLPSTLTFAQQIAGAVAPPGGTVTTDNEGPSGAPDGVSAADPVETSVTTPTGGEIIITNTFVANPPPVGYTFFGRQIQITAPPASVASPLEITFLIDASVVPGGENETTVQIFRNGVLVPDCTGAPQAIPDPCVSARVAAGGGDIEITVLTSIASDWNLGAPPPATLCAPSPATGCRFPALGQKALLLVKDKPDDTKDQILWKWLKGVTTPKADYGFPTVGEGYELCIYEDGALVSSTRIPAGGLCGTNDCWQEKPTLFKYKDKELSPDGALKMVLKEGLVDGKAKILFKGKGTALEMPSLAAINGTVDVRLVQSSGTVCWGATYDPPYLKNDGATFKDKAN